MSAISIIEKASYLAHNQNVTEILLPCLVLIAVDEAPVYICWLQVNVSLNIYTLFIIPTPSLKTFHRSNFMFDMKRASIYQSNRSNVNEYTCVVLKILFLLSDLAIILCSRLCPPAVMVL